MFEKLNALLDRWQELNEAIAQPEIIQNYGKYQSLLKERSSLQVLVETYQRYLSVAGAHDQPGVFLEQVFGYHGVTSFRKDDGGIVA